MSDTLKFFEWRRKQLIWPALFAFGSLFHWWQGGKAMPVADEWRIYLLYSVAPAGVVAILLFLWNLVCALYRIERDAHVETKKMLSAASAQRLPHETNSFVLAKTEFPLWEAAHLLAGTTIQRDRIEGEASSFLHEIKKRIARGDLVDMTGQGRSMANFVKANPHIGNTLASARMLQGTIDQISNDGEISRDQLIQISQDLNRPILGLTDRE